LLCKGFGYSFYTWQMSWHAVYPLRGSKSIGRGMVGFLSEAALGRALLDQLSALGYSIEREDAIGPDGHRPERESHDEVFLKERML
jgi:hypothetical protein